jgi:glycosyltransferase involved in cell wall biosynthesis
MKRLAIVVQRYGREVAGGAEAHARWVVQRLRDRFRITVFTTTALDYITWAEHYPAGEEELDGVPVKRFPIESRRDLELFNSFSRWIFRERHCDEDEERWLRLQGPVSSALVRELRRERMSQDVFLFFTYLYYPTVKGIAEVGDRAVLFPTAHDEPPIRLRLYRRVFAAPSGFMLNTETERRFLEGLFPFAYRPRIVLGMGIDWPADDPDRNHVKEKFGLKQPYALSFGRITAGKGHDLVVRGFSRSNTEMDLVLFGKLEIELPEDPRFRYLGFLSDQEKWAVIAGAALTIHPSPYESLSLALLESWAVGVPALVNGECAVLKDHVERSAGGLPYRGEEDFRSRLEEMSAPGDQLREMGEAGRSYSRSRYEASAVADRYADFLNRIVDFRGR